MNDEKHSDAVRLRFAPSPTGYLHIGNIRLALFNWLFALRHRGSLLLRFDDTDFERGSETFVKAIKEDLTWLGLEWHRSIRQSERQQRYDEVIQDLRARGALYACFETPEELTLQRSMQRRQGHPPIYNRASRALSKQQVEERIARGEQPHWRFYLGQARDIHFKDLCRGSTTIPLQSVSDPVLIRKDGHLLYTLSSVIDDIDYGITHIIRGEDHVVNTAVQIALFEEILTKSTPPTLPQFAHVSLILDENSRPLSKRDTSLSIQNLRQTGFEPETILSYLTALGGQLSGIDFEDFTCSTGSISSFLAKLAEQFDLNYYSRNAPRFQPSSLQSLNKRRLSMLSYSAIEGRLREAGLTRISEQHWKVLRENIACLSDLKQWQEHLKEDARFFGAGEQHVKPLKSCLTALQSCAWNAEALGKTLKDIMTEHQMKPRNFFRLLRQVVTGMSEGPSVIDLMLLLPQRDVIARIEASLLPARTNSHES